MADITFEGMDDLIRALDAAGAMDEDTVKEILNAGADVALEEIRKEIRRSRYKISGYAPYVKKGKVSRSKGGDPKISVTVSGTNDHGERRGTVLFVLNYGRRSSDPHGAIQPGYFWTTATRKAQAQAAKAMEEVLSKKLKEEGL